MTDADPRTPRTVVPIDSSVLLAETFDREQVTGIRHGVAACVEASGLDGQRLDDFVLAVNELITNAVRHGGGRGWLRLWCADRVVYCTVSDTGTGIDSDRLDNRRRPTPDTAGGWGLWLARQLSDDMLVRTGPTGTTVRISAAVGAAGPASASTAGSASAGPARPVAWSGAGDQAFDERGDQIVTLVERLIPGP